MMLLEQAYLFFGYLSVALVMLFVAYRFRFFKFQEDNKLNVSFLCAGLGAFLYFAVQYIFAVIAMTVILSAYYGYDAAYGKLQTVYYQGFIAVLGIVLGLGALLFYTKRYFFQLWLRGPFVKSFLIGVLTWFVAYPVVACFDQLYQLFSPGGEQSIVSALRALQVYPNLFLCLVLGVTVFVPIAEELIFRGLVQTSLKSYLPTWGAIVVSSAIFAAFHYSYSQGLANLGILPALFILSCFLGALFERQKTLVAACALHMTFNSVSIAMLILGS